MFRNWNRWSTVYFILAALLMAVSFFCVCNVNMFADGMDKISVLSENLAYIAFFLANIIACVMFVIGAVKSQYVPNMAFLCIFVILFAFNMISTFKIGRSVILDSPKFGLHEYELPHESLLYILQFFLVLLVFFIIIDFLPKVCDGKSLANLLSLLFITVVFVLVVISYFVDASKYVEIFKGFMDPSFNLFKKNSIQSIIFNPNPYSFLLFTALVASSILHYQTGKWWWILPMFYFFLHIPFSFCRVSIVVSLVYFIAYFVIRFIITLKKHLKMNIITICVVSSVLVGISIFLVVLECLSQWTSRFFDAFIANIGNLSGRIELWTSGLTLFKNYDFGHGYGFKMFEYVLEFYVNGASEYSYGAPIHNGFLDFLGTGGVIFALVGLVFYVILFVRTIRIIKYDAKTAILNFLLIACGLGFSMFETGRICFATNLDYTVLSMFVWIPVSDIYLNQIELTKFEKTMVA